MQKFIQNMDFWFVQGVKRKNKLILSLMGALVYPNPAAYREQLIRFSALSHANHSEVCSLLVKLFPWLGSALPLSTQASLPRIAVSHLLLLCPISLV
jgi:hypothetical protein